MKKVKLFVAIPTTGTHVAQQIDALRKIEHNYKDEITFVYPANCVHRMFHDHARNAMVDEFLATDCDLMWFLDSDVTPPLNILDYITKHWDKWQLAGGVYPVFMTPPREDTPQVLYTVYAAHGEKMAPTNVPHKGLDYVDGLATGCIFIKRKVFDKLEKPWFSFHYDEKTRNIKLGEDIDFCKRVNKFGYKFFVDYEMACGHQKSICLALVYNYAQVYAKKAIAAYDQSIRGQVEALQESVRNQINSTRSTKSKLILPSDLG